MSMSGLVDCSGASASSIQPTARPWRHIGCRPGILPRATPFCGHLPTRSFNLHDDVATEETIAGELTITAPTQVEEYQRAFALVAETAVYEADAVTIIEEVPHRRPQDGRPQPW